jgi:hypothetical protein
VCKQTHLLALLIPNYTPGKPSRFGVQMSAEFTTKKLIIDALINAILMYLLCATVLAHDITLDFKTNSHHMHWLQDSSPTPSFSTLNAKGMIYAI